MSYYYASATQQTTNATANTDTLLADIKTNAAGHRAYVQKLQAGVFTNAIDNQVRLRIHRLTSLGTYASGTALTPQPAVADAPAANALASTLPTLGTGVLATVPAVQLAFNTRGTGLWAAFTPDEAVGMVGASTGVNSLLVLDSQAIGASVAVAFKLFHSE
jgi:hypothetical protein